MNECIEEALPGQSQLTLNGIEMGVRPAAVNAVIQENLLLHNAVLWRLAALRHSAEAEKSARLALDLSNGKPALNDYLAFLKKTRDLLNAAAQLAVKQTQPAADPFGVMLALT